MCGDYMRNTYGINEALSELKDFTQDEAKQFRDLMTYGQREEAFKGLAINALDRLEYRIDII